MKNLEKEKSILGWLMSTVLRFLLDNLLLLSLSLTFFVLYFIFARYKFYLISVGIWSALLAVKFMKYNQTVGLVISIGFLLLVLSKILSENSLPDNEKDDKKYLYDKKKSKYWWVYYFAVVFNVIVCFVQYHFINR